VSKKKEFARFGRTTRFWRVMIFLFALILVGFPASGLTTTGQQTGGTSSTGIGPDVVVKKIVPHGEAEKAGLQEGDILLAWSRSDSKGDIQSPFDIMYVETEQGRLGGVQLEGLRGTARQRQSWSLGPSSWAGSPQVIASLWKVDDEATTELMKKFFEGVLKDSQRPAEALRAAQMWMLKQTRWKAPYYWAGFVLQGEWK
jgi:hypothetical protein